METRDEKNELEQATPLRRGGKNRFLAHGARDFSTLRSIVLPILIFALVGGLFLYGLSDFDRGSEQERLRTVEQAIVKATVQCYAVEGAYPPRLQYLESRYGLSLDYDKYIIQYDVFASNIMPTILVIPRGFEETDAGGFGDEDWE